VCPNGKILEFKVEQGTPDGEKFVFKGEADCHPSMQPGSVVFIVAEQKHDVFKRKGADLLITKEISLIESVCGVDFMV
jgi:DnaJ family protein A protein 2